jgi:flagellar protein FlaG
MTTPIAFPVTPTDPNGSVSARPPAGDVANSGATEQAQQSAQVNEAKAPPADAPATTAHFDTRLVIEEDKETKTFIYKTLDRRTGEVIQQFPREQVLRLHREPGYEPGQVLRART